MKYARNIFIIFISAIGILFLLFVWGMLMSLGGLSSLFDEESKPTITYAEFDFSIAYKSNNIVYEYSDSKICSFDGFMYGGGEKTRKWKSYYKSEPESGRIILQMIDDQLELCLSLPPASYLMGDPNFKNEHLVEIPRIYLFDREKGYSIYQKDKVNRVLEEINFEIVSWECTPPLKNSFK